MLRSIRALLLFWTIFASYGLVWLLARLRSRTGAEQAFARAHRRNARRLMQGFSRLRGVFIKMGQVLSVVGTFLPGAYGEELEKLQDRVPPRPFPEMEARLREAFGDAARALFGSLDETPIAAASLAQVHRGTTRDGRSVAVKLLYPGIEVLIRRDLAVLRSLLPIARLLIPIAHLGRILDELAAMLASETDYAHERKNLERLRAAFAGRTNVVVPEVVDELTGGGVLTMSYEAGVKITDLAAQREQGIEPEAVGRLLVDVYFSMLFDHGVFHADPHPGNFLVRPGPCLVILDFGAVEEVTPALAEGMKMVVLGALARDDEQILSGLERMGFVAQSGDRELLARVGREYLKTISGVSIQDFSRLDRGVVEKLSGYQQIRGRLRDIMRSVEYPEGYFYVERTLALLFGLAAQLAPSLGLPGLVLPHASRVFARAVASRAGGSAPGKASA